MENTAITIEELEKLSTIEGLKTAGIARYVPEPRYIPDQNKIKTGVICIPPRRERPLPPSLHLYAVEKDGKQMLLRTADISLYESECALAYFTDRVFREGGAYVSSPAEVGAFCDDTYVYSLYNFYGGDNLARRLPEFYTPQQHELGVEAGKQLKKLHSVLPDEGDAPAEEEDAFMLIARLQERKTDYKGFKQAADFLKNHHSIINGRPVAALHGDFSANTLFLDNDLNVGMLPLQNTGWGDPIRDLAALPDSCNLPFIKGVFKGLYDGNPPKDFFELFAFYSTLRAFEDISAAQDNDLLPAIIRAEKLAADFDNYQSVVPIWY